MSSANITFFGEHNTIIGSVANSGGAIFATESHLVFSNGSSCELVENAAKSGGAILIAESQLIFTNGSYHLAGNQADYGGAIHASESEMVIEVNNRMNFNMTTNLAMHSGGGLYMTMSELNTKGYNLYVTENRANGKGGGIHAANSSIMVEGAIHLINNEAENGGGISLERYAKLMGSSVNDSINLMSNKANRNGGALYVDDKTNPEMCAAIIIAPDDSETSLKTRCFSKSAFFNFSGNSAGISGTNLFGGLFDRCTVNAETYQMSKKN